MHRSNVLLTFMFLVTANLAWAYGGGGGGGTKSCEKPKFSDFNPAANAEAAAGTAFSFTASKNTYPTTLKVTVKDQPVEVKTDKKADGTFSVSGKLPDAVKSGYARIVINADAQSNCKGSGGWLVKIKE